MQESSDQELSDIASATVLNLDLSEVKLSSLWSEKTAVIIFIRHFG